MNGQVAYKKRAMKGSLRGYVMPCSDWLKFCQPASSTLVLTKQCHSVMPMIIARCTKVMLVKKC